MSTPPAFTPGESRHEVKRDDRLQLLVHADGLEVDVQDRALDRALLDLADHRVDGLASRRRARSTTRVEPALVVRHHELEVVAVKGDRDGVASGPYSTAGI
jgi:hypothetical protein